MPAAAASKNRSASSDSAQYRPFRVAVWTVYLCVLGLFCLAVIVSTVRSVYRMTPRPRDTGETRAIPECVDRVQQAFQSLDDERKDLSRASTALHADVTWNAFRIRWLDELRTSEALCGLDAPDRVALKRLFRRLEHVEDLYTTAAVQYAGEIGPSVDRLRSELAQMQKLR